jgi:TonB family protein
LSSRYSGNPQRPIITLNGVTKGTTIRAVFELRDNHANAKPRAMKFSSPKTAALFCFAILIAIPLIVAEGKEKDAGMQANQLAATDVHGRQSHCSMGQTPGWLSEVVKSPSIQYPDWGSNHHEMGSGVFRMTVDPASGKVTKVVTVKSTGHRDLDDSAAAGLGKWRWKAQSWKEADVEVNFTMGKDPHSAKAVVPGFNTSSAAKPPPATR